jgi:hypothetical protein
MCGETFCGEFGEIRCDDGGEMFCGDDDGEISCGDDWEQFCGDGGEMFVDFFCCDNEKMFCGDFGEMFCGEVGSKFCCDDGGEMFRGDGLMLGAGPSRGWLRETTRGKPGGRCGLLREACLPACAESCAAVLLVRFLVGSVGAFFSTCVPV